MIINVEIIYNMIDKLVKVQHEKTHNRRWLYCVAYRARLIRYRDKKMS